MEDSIVRVHNGVADVLATAKADKNWNVTFETDKFSTYAIAFSDSVIDTGDSSMLVLYAYLISAGHLLVTIILASVPHTFSRIISPIATGADMYILLITFITSNILALGIGLSVFTGHFSIVVLAMCTDEVTTRTGNVASDLAYSSPRGQELPVTE